MKRLGIGIGLLVLTSCSPLSVLRQMRPAPLDFSAVAGRWGGTVRQRDTGSVYPVRLKIDPAPQAGGVAGSSDYPSLGCGGDLVAVGRRGETAVVREVLTHGQEVCLDNILLYLRPNKNGTLGYTFYQSGDRSLSEPNGEAVLHK